MLFGSKAFGMCRPKQGNERARASPPPHHPQVDAGAYEFADTARFLDAGNGQLWLWL